MDRFTRNYSIAQEGQGVKADHEKQELDPTTHHFAGSIRDCICFSFTIYTTLGFGDIDPHDRIRQLVGLESLTGLLLITWTASFLHYEIQRHWNKL